MESPNSSNEARKLIERIRLEHSPEGTSKLSSIIKNALEILSAELYDTSTHFLREFLQNADDNDYDPGVIPWLQLSYEPGFLRVDCNEVGFGASNVEAICTIRNSTKSGERHEGRTGEKGIGFKSVFKIADVVWVSSREYAFKFDKNIDFGTIAPVWEEFPRPILESHTSFLLQLDGSCNESQITDSLRNFDHTYLLFLRRLRHVTVNVELNGSLQTIHIKRRDETDEDSLFTVIEMGEKKYTYLIVKEQVHNLPLEVKRPGVGSSEVVLGFPQIDGADPESALDEAQERSSNLALKGNTEETGPDLRETSNTENDLKFQNVHAILPIGNYGLKFIVQGDFLLTANRRHIDVSSPWNIAIRDAIPDAFTRGISRLNSGRMKFLWPDFIPSTMTESFFEPVRREIVARLRDLPVLESFSGQLVTPLKLTYVESSFVDHAGEPFCLSEQTTPTYLSLNYHHHLKNILYSLGVEEMSNEKFVKHFEHMVSESGTQFYLRSEEWHSELARALLPLTEDVSLKAALRRLAIVPLSNGQWVSAESEPRMLEEQSMLGDVQVSESLRIIHIAAMKKGSRRSLWSSLDIQPISRQEICQYIVDAHQNPFVDPVVWTRAQLVAHARFLYHSEWRPSSTVDLWVVNDREQRVRSSKAYYVTDAGRDEPTTRVFKAMRSAHFDVLHDDYFSSNEAVENEDIADSKKSIEYSDEIGSPNVARYGGDSTDSESLGTYDSGETYDSGGYEGPRSRTIGDVESQPEETSESGDDESSILSLDRRAFLEDIADMQRVVYPIYRPEFREFLEWRSLKREWDHLVQSRDCQDETNALENEDDWVSYLKGVLQVETLPRLAQTSPRQKDRGSLMINSDMRRLFDCCDVSDVLHVLISNWNYYAHLIEPQGTTHQVEVEKLQRLQDTLWRSGHKAGSPSGPDPDTANAGLVDELKMTLVNTNVGRMFLRDCVLPNLDPRFNGDSDICLPTLQFQTISKVERQRLAFLQISVESDIIYYMKCLNALKNSPSPRRNTVKRLYEEVQSRYDQNVGLTRHAFDNWDYVYISKQTSVNSTSHGSWMTLVKYMEKGSGLASEYPTCTYLFRSLCDPENLQVTSLINSLSSSPTSKPVDHILKVLTQISQRLKGLEPKQAAEKVTTLKGKRIFPVSETTAAMGQGAAPRFVSSHNKHWYIDDTNEFRSCFGSKVPLLAASTSIVLQLKDLLKALDLDSRKISEVATRRSNPVGRQRVLADTTSFLRSRHCFLDPLIPEGHPGGRDTISAQLQNMSAFSATEILQVFTLVTDTSDLTGQGPQVDAALSVEGTALRVFFAESSLDSFSTSMEWMNLLAQHMEICDLSSLNLLVAALTDPNPHNLYQKFQSRGFYVKQRPQPTPGTTSGDPGGRYLSLSGNAGPMPSAFDPWITMSQGLGQSSGWNWGSSPKDDHTRSRKIPLPRLIHSGAPVDKFRDPDSAPGGFGLMETAPLPEDPFPELSPYRFIRDPYRHEQYTAECMASRLFEDHLGGLYDPIKCWTSRLRSRSGLPEYTGRPGAASFTFRGRSLSKAMWKLLLYSSYRYAAKFSRKRFSIDTVYHCEVFMTVGDSNDWFTLNAGKLQKAQHASYLPSDQEDEVALSQVVVWIRIYFAFTHPRFDFIVDPWLYSAAGGLTIRDGDWAQICLVDNKAEDVALKKKHRRVDDLESGINELGPKTTIADRKSTCVATKKGMSEDAIVKPPGLLEYGYQKLIEGHMRLFVLFRGQESDILRGVICHMPFDKAGSFRSLSYVWGSEQPKHKKRLLVTPEGVLRIRTSLGAALQRIRQSTKDLVLWVDAICIDQEDEDEKAEQIALLPQIYQRATCTLAVVATDNKSDQAVQTLLQIAAVQAYGSDISKWPTDLGLPRTHAPWMVNGLPAKESGIWQHVEYFFRRPWFRRAWIVQEAIAAPTVSLICGKWMFDWNAIRSAMEVVDRALGTTPLADSWQPYMLLTEHREWEVRGRRRPLLDLLETFRYTKAGLQRDHFFSLLGLASDADDDLFDPDYKSSFEEIVRRFAQAFIEQGGGLRLLALAGLAHAGQEAESQPGRFPSWVPDWTNEDLNQGSLSSAVGRGVTFSASGDLTAFMDYDPEDDTLTVAGAVWHGMPIMSVSTFRNEPSQRNKYFQEVDAMIEACKFIRPDRRQHLKETVPVAGGLYPESGVTAPVSITESYAAYRKVLRKDELRAKSIRGDDKKVKRKAVSTKAGGRSSNEPMPASVREKSKTYAALLDAHIVGWRFIMTSNGYCGIAPNGVLPGDKIGIVSGGNVPFIIREGFAPAGGLFLIGECYIDGFMFGEMVQDHKKGTVIPHRLLFR